MCINYIYCSGRISLPPYIVVHCLPKKDFGAECWRFFLEMHCMEDKISWGLIERKEGPWWVQGLDRGFKRSPQPAMKARAVHFQQQCDVYGGWGRERLFELKLIDFYVLFQSFGLRHCVGRGSHTLWEDSHHWKAVSHLLKGVEKEGPVCRFSFFGPCCVFDQCHHVSQRSFEGRGWCAVEAFQHRIGTGILYTLPVSLIWNRF